MDLINNTNNWVKGEIFEGTVIAFFGILTLSIAFIFWKFGETPHAKALTIPVVVIGVLLLSMGVSMYSSNQKGFKEYQNRYQENPSGFIKQEKERVESFQYMYVISKVVATVAFAFAIFAFWFTKNATTQSIAIVFLMLGFSLLVIDYFSEERASIYYAEIIKVLK
jgi:hypothetical protein